MNSFAEWLRKLGFRLPDKSPKEDAVQAEMLVRSRMYKEEFRKWITRGHHQELLKNIYTTYTLNKLGVRSELPLHYMSGIGRHTVVIHYLDVYGKDVFPYLQDYFRDRIMRLGYQLYLSERLDLPKGRLERHILRPQVPAFNINDLPEQLYGNLEVSVFFADQRPVYLEIHAEHLSEQRFNKAFSFDELAELLFV